MPNHSLAPNADPRYLVFGGGYMKKNAYEIEASRLGIISSSYQLGSILAVPVAPWVNNKYGRRWSIMLGSLIMCVGSIIQGFSQHGMHSLTGLGGLQLTLFLREQWPCTSSRA